MRVRSIAVLLGALLLTTTFAGVATAGSDQLVVCPNPGDTPGCPHGSIQDAVDVSAHLRPGTGPVTAAEAGDGDPVATDVTELGDGRYRVSPALAADAEGQLVLTADHERGESLARLDLTQDGYELARDVGPEDTAVEPRPDPGRVVDEAGLLVQSA